MSCLRYFWSVGFLAMSLGAAHCYSQSYAVLSNRDLVLVDEVNCQSQLIGKCNTGLHDIAIDPLTKVLYGASSNGTIHKINKSTAQLTFLGYNPQGFNALTFSSTGVLYAMSGDNDSLYSIDTTTGTATSLGSTSVVSEGDLTFYKGYLYLAGKGGKLVRIDVGNIGNSVVLGQFSNLNSVYGINTMGCEEEVYAFQANDLYKLSPANLLNSSTHCPDLFSRTVNGATSLIESVDWNKLSLGDDTVLCDHDTLVLDVGISGGKYRWQDNSKLPTYEVTQPGLYYVEIMVNNCVFTDSINVQYGKFNSLSLGPDTVFCSGESLHLDVYYPKAQYLWGDGSKASEKFISAPGEYWVQLSVDGCLWSDTIRVDFFTEPAANLGNDTTLCSSDSITIGSLCKGCSYLWSTGSSLPQITTSKPGRYWREVYKDGCSYLDTIEVRFYERVFMKDTTGCDGDELTLTAGIDDGRYLWSNGSTSNEITVYDPGHFWVDVVHECFTYRDSATVEFRDCSCNVYVPNAFSPNDDGLNDKFTIGTVCSFQVFNLSIYNRWGQLVFHSNSPEHMWDGSCMNKPAMDGVYVWSLHYRTNRLEEEVIQGKVQLLR